MRPALHTPNFIARRQIQATLTESRVLEFKQLTYTDIERIGKILRMSTSRTNDYTIGGLYMWRQYFDYSFDIIGNTLFIKGVTEDDINNTAFMLPIGDMPLKDSIGLIQDYCRESGIRTVTLSAVPEDRLKDLRHVGVSAVNELTDWADYIYDADTLVTLTGKKLSKKRNHVNRFMTDNPGCTLESIRPSNINEVKTFFKDLSLDPSKPAIAEFEMMQVADVLSNFDRYPYEGALLRTPDHGIVAFSIGEIIGDTLYVHIEKMNHTISGVGETINNLFARMMTRRYPMIRYINREEDAGDPGLRRAKESYHPLPLLRKFNVSLK